MKTVLNDLESHNLTLTEAVTMAQNRPRWRLQAVSGAVLLVVVCARNEDDDDHHHHRHYHRHCSPVRVYRYPKFGSDSGIKYQLNPNYPKI